MSAAFGIFRICLFLLLMWITTTSDNTAFRAGVFVLWVFLELAFLGNLQETIKHQGIGQKQGQKKGKK
jgi:hypothetical protein